MNGNIIGSHLNGVTILSTKKLQNSTQHGRFQTFLYKTNKLYTEALCYCGSNGNPLNYIYQNFPLMPNHFKYNASLTLGQNFLILVTLDDNFIIILDI